MNPPAPPQCSLLKPLLEMTRDGTDRMEFAKRCLILEALHLTGGYAKEAARILGISQRAMNYQMAQHGLRPKDGIEWPAGYKRVSPERIHRFFGPFRFRDRGP